MKLLQTILECIYPKRCPLCHDIIMPKGKRICAKCRTTIRILTEPRCKKCSKKLERVEDEYCFDCAHTSHHFEEGYGVFAYDRVMQRSMSYFKFHGRREYGEFYGEMLIRFGATAIKRFNPQILIPVPLHQKKRRNRGYNQAEIIGRVLNQGFSIPIRTDLVKRVKNTKAQKELNHKARRKNLHGAFEAAPEVGRYQRVLIVDDIYTTGSTIDAIAGELRKQGVKEVFFIAVCIGSGF